MKKPKTPEQFKKQIQKLARKYDDDPEVFHRRTDTLMEDLLIELDYLDGIAIIRKGVRWCA